MPLRCKTLMVFFLLIGIDIWANYAIVLKDRAEWLWDRRYKYYEFMDRMDNAVERFWRGE